VFERPGGADFAAHHVGFVAGRHRPPFLAYSGLRIGEALGLCWADVDFESGLLRVHRQLSRKRVHSPLKTEAGKREVILAPGIAKLLREHWLASRYKKPGDLIFCSRTGGGLDYRNVGTAFRLAVKRAGITAPGRLSLHSLRHSFASLLIAGGLNVVFVSRQLGHANPNVTLSTYAHLFQLADHAATARQALETSYQEMASGTTP
jgi:integrase